MLYKKVVAAVMAILAGLLFLSYDIQHLRADTADYVRVGLSYAGTAQAYFTVSTAKGLDIYNQVQETGKLLATGFTGKITVRRDSWYFRLDGSLKPSIQGGTGQGTRLGPYHIRLKENCLNHADANNQVKFYNNKGLLAYPAYTGKWEVWAGHYASESDAVTEIEKYKTASAGNSLPSVVSPPLNRYNSNIILEDSNGNTLFAFADTAGFMQLKASSANEPGIINYNGRNYRGAIEVRRQEGSDMTVINYLDIESYLYGVVPGEIESYSPFEAIKGQALVARNYTYCNMNKFSKWGFDLDTTVLTQVYKGYDGEAASTNKAVDETRGMVLKYGDRLALCYYFSSSGGRTEDVVNVWGSSISYLASVEDPYESGKSARYTWEKAITADSIKNIMRGRGNDIGDITGISITKRSEAGRVIEMVISGTKGQPVTFRRETCRTIFGLNSQWFYISTDSDASVVTEAGKASSSAAGSKAITADGTIAAIKGNNGRIAAIGADGKLTYLMSAVPTKYIINGRGYGHAVGFSQEGAKGFAAKGKRYDEILLHYFPGTRLETAE